MPKSVIFAMPSRFITMMFDGFTSRCTMSCWCANAEPVGDLRDDVHDLVARRGSCPAAMMSFSSVALEELHRHVGDLVGLADVVDGDDVRDGSGARPP